MQKNNADENIRIIESYFMELPHACSFCIEFLNVRTSTSTAARPCIYEGQTCPVLPLCIRAKPHRVIANCGRPSWSRYVVISRILPTLRHSPVHAFSCFRGTTFTLRFLGHALSRGLAKAVLQQYVNAEGSGMRVESYPTGETDTKCGGRYSVFSRSRYQYPL